MILEYGQKLIGGHINTHVTYCKIMRVSEQTCCQVEFLTFFKIKSPCVITHLCKTTQAYDFLSHLGKFQQKCLVL